jgi:putative heme-binding domain-containing protein
MQFRVGFPIILFRVPGRFRWPCLASLALALIGFEFDRTIATEPWTDPRMPVKEGLELWLDASTIHAAAAANGHVIPPANPGSRIAPAIAVWHDGSGQQWDMQQAFQDHRPTLVYPAAVHPDLPVVRFDGLDDALLSAAGRRSTRALTLFLVAAPLSNSGGFRAFAAANRRFTNDYVSGLNLDQGPFATPTFSTLNIEGIGFQGAQNLRTEPQPLGKFQLLAVTVDDASGQVRLHIDGQPHGRRTRAVHDLALDQFVVGARFYSNSSTPPHLTGHLQGELAELLVFRRSLNDDERQQLEQYLRRKYAPLFELPVRNPDSDAGLRTVADPPEVQVLVPGFEAFRLPLDLPNVNNLRFTDAGELLALGYDGNLFRLVDSDGDGIEDRSELWWNNQGRLRSPIGMAILPPNSPWGRGVVVAAKGKVARISDEDGDGVAETESILATGWAELPHNVDALGVAIGAAGEIFFGLGTADFTNPFLIGADGRSQYDPRGERGTIQRLRPGAARPEQFCSGIRFPVGLAVHPGGQLFCTDQEGATWLPNGNPFDELLQIEEGRHYGFPPRHPRHLPRVVDEPSVFNYGPQHQSTCGLSFNFTQTGKWLGPDEWRGNLFVAGYSRGKIFRTRLAQSEFGTVASTELFACLQRLCVDVAVAPNGDLLVATHSGMPDWGSGPAGKGTLYKIRYRDRETPQPVATWSTAPGEFAVAFDRPCSIEQFQDVISGMHLEAGKYVGPGDRFETLRPGYQIVQMQQAERRQRFEIDTISLSSDRTVLSVRTRPDPVATSYALTLPARAAPRETGAETAPAKSLRIRSIEELDLALNRLGIQMDWHPQSPPSPTASPPTASPPTASPPTASPGDSSSEERQSADAIRSWLPHFDTDVTAQLLGSWPGHQLLRTIWEQSGELRLRTQLRCGNWLQPVTQPGSKLDEPLPAEEAILNWYGRMPFAVRIGDQEFRADRDKAGRFLVRSSLAGLVGWKSLELRMATGLPLESQPGQPILSVAFSTADDARLRPLGVDRFRLPWAVDPRADDPSAGHGDAANRPDPRLAGGDWYRGRAIFHGAKASCSKCHSIAGEGGQIGPDLSNLWHRDYDSVERDIIHPSAALNPDYVTYRLATHDGRILLGTLRSRDEELLIGDLRAEVQSVSSDDIESIVPQSVSVMPEGLLRELSDGERRDLFTFLLSQTPSEFAPAPISRPDAPPARGSDIVDRILAGGKQPASLKPLQLLLVSGPKDHGENEHDYPQWRERWAAQLALAPDVTVRTASGWPDESQWQTADVVVLYSANPDWSADKARQLDAFQQRGGGLVLIHYAVNGQQAPNELAERIGLAWQGGRSKFRHGALQLKVTAPEHPIVRGIPAWDFVDESYWELVGDRKQVQVLAMQQEEGAEHPMLWTTQRGSGRVFVSILGHYSWTFDDPVFRAILLRGIGWVSASDDSAVDRFQSIVPIGARIDRRKARTTPK